MTKEEFMLLDSEEQNSFIESGQSFTLSQPVIASPTETKQQSGTSCVNGGFSTYLSTTQIDGSGCSFPSSQAASSFPIPVDNSAKAQPRSHPASTISTPANQLVEAPTVGVGVGVGVANSNDNYSQVFDGIMIENPIELLNLCDEDISSGRVALHGWQVEFMLDFAFQCMNRNDTFPFQALVRACNGSGKDKYIIAPCIVWLCMRFKKTIGVVTSASGAQLDNQTCRYIKSLADKVNRKLGLELWSTKYREYTIDFGEGSVSHIYCYATDEPKKAEGYHPMEFGAKMVLMVSEDKTVPDDINVAINKCTGYTHRVHVSTPGAPIGHFYDYCMTAVKRESMKDVLQVTPTDWIEYHVPASKCSHLSTNYIQQMKRDLPGGEHGAPYKSQVEAEFCVTDEMVVIPYTYIWRAVKQPKCSWKAEMFNTAGLDLSDGGDETVLAIRNGNKLIKVIPFRFQDTEDTITFLDTTFRENKLDNSQSKIFGDCGGLGKPMLDRLKRMGWKNIHYVDNRSKAARPLVYKNRGSEVFFHMRDLLEHNELILINDDLTMKQLGGRYYKLVDGRIHQLLSKIEQKSKGYRSPDRADAVNLAFWNFEGEFIEIGDEHKLPYEVPTDDTDVQSPQPIDLRLGNKQSFKSFVNQRTGKSRDLSILMDELNEHNARMLVIKGK